MQLDSFDHVSSLFRLLSFSAQLFKLTISSKFCHYLLKSSLRGINATPREITMAWNYVTLSSLYQPSSVSI